MRHLVQSRLAKALAGIVCAALVATWAIGQVLDNHQTAQRDKHEVARMTQKMKTMCIGRFLIDMPAEAQVELVQPRISGFNIVTFDESSEEFQTRLAEREAAIRARPDHPGGRRNLELLKEVKTDKGLIGKIFVHSRKIKEGTRVHGFEIERYRYEGVAVEALVHSEGISIDITSAYYIPDRIDKLMKLIDQLALKPENHIPTVPGFCIDRVYFHDPLGAEEGEQVMMLATLPSHPDIEFMLILAAGTKPDEQGLLERDSAAESGLSLAEKFRMTKLRAGVRDIGGLAGEEVIRTAVEENEANGFSAWWEVNGTEDKVLVPHLVFKMNTGVGEKGPVPASLSHGAAMDLWDKISSSLRLRPIAPLKAAQVEPPVIPLGAVAEAGEACPQSGWWLCSDSGQGMNVFGGQRQFLRKGQKMPQALLLPRQTLWQKVRGLQPSYEAHTRTGWKLVDKRERKRVAPAVSLAQAKFIGQVGDIDGIATDRASVYPEPSIGWVAKTGALCPASGWWRCDEAHALDGTRWFAAGTSLPAATFALPPAAFGHAFGKTQMIQRRSVWQLMRCADAPEREAASTQEGPEPPTVV